VITHLYRVGDESSFTSCERCTHITSTRDILSENHCAHGILLQSLASVLGACAFSKETRISAFSDQFSLWALNQSQQHDGTIQLKKHGGNYSFLVIGDTALCAKESVSQLSICTVLLSEQGIQLRCRNVNCTNKFKHGKINSNSFHENILLQGCPHVRQLCVSAPYQKIMSIDAETCEPIFYSILLCCAVLYCAVLCCVLSLV
jgi:hypothetical protein